MILASHQPDFFPYMGYFYKMFQSDIFVFSDNVQYSKSGRHNYNEILTPNGPHRFTLPVHKHCVDLNKMEIAADENTVQKMLKTLVQEYRKAEHFSEAFPVIDYLLRKAPYARNLAQFNTECIIELAERFGLDSRTFCISSDLPLVGRKDERIISMCKHLKADCYYSGTAAKDYHIEADYEKNGIRLVYSDYLPITYPQVGGKTVINMSVIDYVMNCGFNLPKEWVKYE